MHPTTRILIYILAALALPGLSFFQLALVGGLALILALRARGRLARLVWRARWLFLLLLLANAYQMPGAPLWSVLGSLSPSLEGSLTGLGHCGRLLIILALLDVLVLGMPGERLLTGVHGLLRPLVACGLDPRRAALRLALTMHAMERRDGAHVLRDLLRGQPPGHDLPTRQYLVLAPWRYLDGLALGGAILALALPWLSA